MGVVFSKTAKGQEEMTNRSGGLTPRVRRVLIMVDGKKTVDDLRAALAADDLTHTLGMLEEEGYIEVTGTRDDKSGQARPLAGQALPPVGAFRPLTMVMSDPMNLAKARNFMANTLRTFVGAVGISSLLTRIEDAEGHEALRGAFDEWYHAIVTSRDGRREAEGLRTRLLEVL